ncbi:hypothetical protein AAF712_015385 [Marasmius tenuissimus]|uniref:XPG-I domain-containing protein n=1 Tax=Marasmius tenuissimus TaxID=585030 RepID=A0ABR2ZBU9_9AGAR
MYEIPAAVCSSIQDDGPELAFPLGRNGAIEMVKLSGKSYAELKNLCRSCKLSQKGTKDEMKARLSAFSADRESWSLFQPGAHRSHKGSCSVSAASKSFKKQRAKIIKEVDPDPVVSLQPSAATTDILEPASRLEKPTYLTLRDGTRLEFLQSEVPDPGFISFAADIDRLGRTWTESYSGFREDECHLKISGRGIALEHWPAVYKLSTKTPGGGSDKRWEGLKKLWNKWRWIGIRYTESTPDDFWDEFSTEARTLSLLDWAIQERIRRRGQLPVLGVDANNLIDSVVAAASKRERFHTDGIVGALLGSILSYTEVPAIVLFVFDEQGNDTTKSGKKPINKPIAIHNTARRLIQSLGGHILNGPCEADIQLSALARQGLIDAVILNDSDMLVHGVSQVLRYNKNKSRSTRRLFFDAYNTEDIKKHLEVTQDGLLLVAVLCGSSYADGVKGCGMKVALELARCGFGEIMTARYQSAHSPSSVNLHSWKKGLKFEPETNTSGKLSSQHPALASRISQFDPLTALHGYPARDKLPKYTRVDMLQSPTSAAIQAYSFIRDGPSFDQLDIKPKWTDSYTLVPKEVFLPAVRDFCTTYLHWSGDDTVCYLNKKLWAGVIMQMLLSPFLRYDARDTGNPMPTVIHTPWHRVQLLSFPKQHKEQKYRHSEVKYIQITFGIVNFAE